MSGESIVIGVSWVKLEGASVEAMVSSVVLDESEIAMEGDGVRLDSSCLVVGSEEVLAEGIIGKGAGRGEKGCSTSWAASRAAMRSFRARMRSSVVDLGGHEVGTKMQRVILT